MVQGNEFRETEILREISSNVSVVAAFLVLILGAKNLGLLISSRLF